MIIKLVTYLAHFLWGTSIDSFDIIYLLNAQPVVDPV